MTPWLLLLIPFAGSGIVAVGPNDRRWLGGAACAVLALTFVAASLTAPAGGSEIAWGGGLKLSVEMTPLSKLVAVLVPFVAFAVLAYAASHEDKVGLRRLIALMLVFVGGMELLVIAGDFLTLLIGWELVGACSWALIGHRWREDATGGSANFAFLTTRAGDLGLFVAAMAAFGGSGSFAYSALASLSPVMLALVSAGVLVSAAAKSGQVPFSPWLFRAMDGPTSVSALLHAATMVAAGAYLLARLQPMLDPVPWFAPAAIAIGLTTALAGGVVALVQPHAKKLLAASTSAHYGLMFVATGAGYPLVAILHLVAHGFFKALLFLAAGIAGERAGDFQLRHMGFGRVLPIIASASAIGALALAGVPPLGAGWTKEEVVGAAGEHGFALALPVMVAGALSAAYAARFQLMAFARSEPPPEGDTPSWPEKISALLLALATLLLSALWLPGAHEAIATILGTRLPSSKTVEFVVSLLLLIAGVGAGALLARNRNIGIDGATGRFADWLGLPTAIRFGVTRPIEVLAEWAVMIDDRVLGAPPRAVGALGGVISSAMAHGDRKIVDRGVGIAAHLGNWFAEVTGTLGERIADALPGRSAGAVAFGGRQSVRLQTGMSHHYYAMIASGLALIVALAYLGT